ncbi:hypothetical protein BC827DRAFT_1265066 [Russula dissimulans]|nr:hypothetical protein BC827DRAFT_1265066 [Russula dissimulans]
MTTPSSLTSPMYISAHSAETILSDFRPLKLQADALSFLNLLLDDILANIITSSRSILTDRLKTGLLKTVPTMIGKDALLEAEMELRAYWQRPNAVRPSPAQLMRLKCEAYSTLNDEDEDAQGESIIQERLRSQGIDPPKSIIVAPAALYLTAILECICERILSSVGRVATRDSSKDAAGTHDLFVALCEDDAIYPIFKGSKGRYCPLRIRDFTEGCTVYEVIEGSLKHSSKPRRSKSFTKSERPETRDVQSAEPPSLSRTRLSSESAASGALSGSAGSDHHPQRTSQEKAKAIKLFRPSSDRDATASSDAVSRIATSRKGFGAQNDGINESAILDTEGGNSTQDFDDLVRSSDTMKVSLTPDRLRTMETAKQQQRQPHKRTGTGKFSLNDQSRAPSAAANAGGRYPPSPDQQYHGVRKPSLPSLPHVDSIIEDEEPKETVVSPRATRPHPVAKPSDVRARSVSTSGVSNALSLRVPKKSSISLKSSPSPPGVRGRDLRDAPNSSSPTSRRLHKTQRNRESIDIDDIINGSEDGSESSPDPGDQATQGRTPLYPVSKATRDLISFLEEGPPPEIQPASAATVSSVSLTPTTKSAKSSRLQRMMSKLSLSKEDVQRSRAIGSASAPSTPLGSSVRSFGANNPPPLPVAVKPVPPPLLSIPSTVPISPPASAEPSPDDDPRHPITQNGRPARKMSIRKAVPTWGATVNHGVSTPLISDPSQPIPTSPPIAPPTPPISYGQAQYQSPPTPALDAKEANGHAQDNHELPQTDSPIATSTRASTGLETPSRSPAHQEDENGRAEQSHPRGTFRPRSLQPNHRSSMNDKRSSGQPQPSNAQPIALTPSLSESLALDLRRLMSQATTASECRLILDTFLTRAGIAPPILDTTPSNEEPLERSLVDHFLGTDPEEPQISHIALVTAEAERHPNSSTIEHLEVKESNGLHQITTHMDPASAVHARHIVSPAVAVVS